MKGMAEELAPSVRVNAVTPGFVKTPRLSEIAGEKGWNASAKVIPIDAGLDQGGNDARMAGPAVA